MIAPYYADDAITLYCADCLDLARELPPVDHVITDPPYEAEAHTLQRRLGVVGHSTVRTEPIDFDPITTDERLAAGRLMATLASGWILVFCQVEAAMLWRDALVPARYYRTQLWRKLDPSPQFTGDRPGMGYESIVTCWCGDGRSMWNGGGRHGIYEYAVVRAGRTHQTEKPEALMIELLRLFTHPGQLVLDPFAGSATTLVAAKRLGRRAIGVERDERYCEAAARRLSQEALPLFAMDGIA